MEKHLSIIKKYNLLAGDRIVVPKSGVRLVQHHAIFLGWMNGNYWIIENKDFIGVRLITAREFFKDVDHVTRVEPFKPSVNYSRADLIKVALRLKGKAYVLVGYNCENFCNEVQHGKNTSHQAQVGVALGILAVLAIAHFSD